jgi:hypothetical protein
LFGIDLNEHADLPAKHAWLARAAELAKATQRQLGSECEVLYITPGGAWRWVTPPWDRVKRA